jgi:hypothetical protein
MFRQIVLFVIFRCWKKKHPKEEKKAEINEWDKANMLTEQSNHFVRVTPKEQMPYRCKPFVALRTARLLTFVFPVNVSSRS